jgi:ABC-type nitrate/sulfonate/bicarbonate transport system permease component
VSAAIAIIVSVVTELVGGADGLGRSIVLAQSANRLPTVYALILTTGALGMLVNSAFSLAEKPLLFWHPSHRSGRTK